MGLYFLDTSALVKRYVLEAGTVYITRLTDPLASNESWIASVGPVELIAALYRRVSMNTITVASARNAEQAFRGDLRRIFDSIELNPTIVSRAMGLAKLHFMRAYDSVQLATALELQIQRRSENLSMPIFLSADQALNQAALAEGLLVDDPNRYP